MKQTLRLMVCCLCLLLVLGSISARGRSEKMKHYYNKKFDFCVDFPLYWIYQESFTRNGATFAPSDRRAFFVPPKISIGAHMDQPNENEKRLQTLNENVQSFIDGLRTYSFAEDLRITRQEDLVVQGLRARIVALRYRDAKSNQQWFSEDLNVIDQHHIVYFAELRCHPRDTSALEPIFNSLVHSLRLQCKEKTKVP